MKKKTEKKYLARLEGYSKSTFRISTSPKQLSGSAPPRVSDPASTPTHDDVVAADDAPAAALAAPAAVAGDAIAAIADAAAVCWSGGGGGGREDCGGGGAAPLGSRLISSKTLSAAPTAWVLHATTKIGIKYFQRQKGKNKRRRSLEFGNRTKNNKPFVAIENYAGVWVHVLWSKN